VQIVKKECICMHSTLAKLVLIFHKALKFTPTRQLPPYFPHFVCGFPFFTSQPHNNCP
jgi:hypothetical protein